MTKIVSVFFLQTALTFLLPEGALPSDNRSLCSLFQARHWLATAHLRKTALLCPKRILNATVYSLTFSSLQSTSFAPFFFFYCTLWLEIIELFRLEGSYRGNLVYLLLKAVATKQAAKGLVQFCFPKLQRWRLHVLCSSVWLFLWWVFFLNTLRKILSR